MWKLLKSILFMFDAEKIHRLILYVIRVGIHFRNIPLVLVSGERIKSLPDSSTTPIPEVFGMKFKSHVGLAAGFDKDAEFLLGLPALGFGFAEIGTVTPRPQPGNPKPRLYRDLPNGALFNRMGFNSLGVEVVSKHLAEARARLPENFRIGVNVGKNKDTPNEEAKNDYLAAIRPLEGLADYLVINVSSPNTPGLRSLQTVEALKPIVGEVMQVAAGWKKKPPVLLKLAPEIKSSELCQLIQSLESWGVDGWVLTNTLAGTFHMGGSTWEGGWSGEPLRELSRNSLIQARKCSQKPIISVGGITTVEEGLIRVKEGAQLIQIYTGWIFRGPRFPVELSRKIGSIAQN